MKSGMRFILLMVLISLASAFAEDWPQYLGPNRDGTSPQKGILRSWPEGGPEVLWTVKVGRGYGGPVVTDGKVDLLDRDDEVGDSLRCIDLSSGEELWHFADDAPGRVSFPGSRSVRASRRTHSPVQHQRHSRSVAFSSAHRTARR